MARRLIAPLLLALATVSTLTVDAFAWPPGGVVLSESGIEPRVLLGKDGNVLTYWSDGRSQVDLDIYGQLLASNGQRAIGWPDSGLALSIAPNEQRTGPGLAHPDGSFFVSWTDARDFPNFDPYFTRVLPDGHIDPAWAQNGTRVTDRASAGVQQKMTWAAPDTLVNLCSDAVNGVGAPLLKSFAISPLGAIPLWDPDVLIEAGGDLGGTAYGLEPDGAGGVYVILDPVEGGVWIPGGRNETDLYVVRIGRDGSPAAGWEGGLKPIAAAPGGQWWANILADGEGGLYVTWADERDGAGTPNPEYSTDIRLQRLTPGGDPHPGWPADGLVVNDAAGWQNKPNLAPDGEGGVYVAWDDITIGVIRVRAEGTIAPGWPVDGIQISDLYAWTTTARMVTDGAAGVYVLFDDLSNNDLYVQHVLASGRPDPGWPSTGYLASLAADGDIVSDGAGGCFVGARGVGGIFVSRYGRDGPVPIKLAEATVDVAPGRVYLVWRGAEADASVLQVERRGRASEEWRVLGMPHVISADEMGFEDLDVEPGEGYAYRLMRGRTEVLSQEQWVEIPAAPAFALSGARPNPARSRELSIDFTLAGGAQAEVQVLDLAGRREYVRSLTGLRPGRHSLPLAEARLAPGVHWLELREGSRVAHSRFVVVR